MTMDALRLAAGPLTTKDIAAVIALAKGVAGDDEVLQAIIAQRVSNVLRALAKRGGAKRAGSSRNGQWSLAPLLL